MSYAEDDLEIVIEDRGDEPMEVPASDRPVLMWREWEPDGDLLNEGRWVVYREKRMEFLVLGLRRQDQDAAVDHALAWLNSR